jgi:hypothetical protein
MGVMRFRVFPTQRITEVMASRAYLSGIDRVSWPVRTSVEGGELVIQRLASDAACLNVPWPVEGHGTLTLSSGTLIEQDEPYQLPLELARGTIAQVRNQLSDWQVIGLTVPAAVSAKLAEAGEQFSWAAVTQEEPAASAEHAEAAIRSALAAGDLLAAAYSEQALGARRRNGGNRATFLGANLGATLLDDAAARQFLLSFNAAQTPLRWHDVEASEGHFSWTTSDKQIQWCRTHGLKVLVGPLLSLDRHALPDWLYLFEDDFDSLMDFVSALVRATVERYRGNVDYWICAGRVNGSEALDLSEQKRLRLVARSIELVRALDPHTPALVSFDRPWAEYMRQRESDFPPLHFADALARADLGLAGLFLEVNAGWSPGGTHLRHAVDFNRQLDAWSLLGLPLWMSLSVPSGHAEDPLARHKESLPGESWTPAAQRAWAARFVPLSLAKPMVQGVVWNQLNDSQPHDFPHGGLFDVGGKPKPALRTLAAIRKAYVK